MATSTHPAMISEAINYSSHLRDVVLVVHPNVKAKNLDEFIALAKKEPGKISYASYGVQLNAEQFQKAVGIRLNTIQYKGVEAVHALIAGQVDAMFDGLFTALPNIRAGRSRALAVLQDQRSSFAPDIPSTKELGVKIPSSEIWYALVGPAKMDPSVVDYINNEFRIALQAPEVKARLAKLNVEPIASKPDVLDRRIRDEYERFSVLVKELGISPQ